MDIKKYIKSVLKAAFPALKKKRFKNNNRECSVDGCDIAPVSKGYCRRHYGMDRRYGSPLHIQKRAKNKKTVARNNKIKESHAKGEALADIAVKHGISRERVRQILKSMGIGRLDGGYHVKAKESVVAGAVAKNEKRKLSLFNLEARYQKVYGCSIEVMASLNVNTDLNKVYSQEKGSAAYAYFNQKNKAIHRGIDWELTFPEWIWVWRDSGKFGERGRGKDKYCMARYGDTGAYSKDNIYIITNGDNIKEARLMDKYR